jgi:hypothetical protein
MMQNQTSIATAAQAGTTTIANAEANNVVEHDTSPLGLPSIKLSGLSMRTTVKTAAPSKLITMEEDRINWENKELAASNKRLYSILADAYSYYLVMKQDSDKDVRKVHMEELEGFIAKRGYTFSPTTHDMTRVVKCVFGVDRRRVSAYSLTLREALRQEIDADDLADFIEQEGGVEQIRLGYNNPDAKPKSISERAELAKEKVISEDLGMLKFDPALFAADADWVDKQVVIVATYLPTGEFQANAVINHGGAVNAALAAYQVQLEATKRQANKAERDAEKAAEAAFKQAVRAEKKHMNANKQKASTEATKAAAAKQEKFFAHVDSLFETQQA